MSTHTTPKPYINPYIGGTLLGIVLFLAFFVTGNGLGASGGLTHVVSAVFDLVAPDHLNQNGYFAKYAGGMKSALEHASVLMLAGTFLGGTIAGLLNRRFKPEIRKGPRIGSGLRLVLAFTGGAIMGFGARLARGCTSGQALSGGAVLSVGSFAFMCAMFGGGYALAYFARKLWND
jgi:uncharacterized membrane protein YedE/YeeE